MAQKGYSSYPRSQLISERLGFILRLFLLWSLGCLPIDTMSDSMTDYAGKETTQIDSDNMLCSQPKQDHYGISYPYPLCHRGMLKQKGIDDRQ